MIAYEYVFALVYTLISIGIVNQVWICCTNPYPKRKKVVIPYENSSFFGNRNANSCQSIEIILSSNSKRTVVVYSKYSFINILALSQHHKTVASVKRDSASQQLDPIFAEEDVPSTSECDS